MRWKISLPFLGIFLTDIRYYEILSVVGSLTKIFCWMAMAFLAKGIGKKKNERELNQWTRDLNTLQKERAFSSNDH